MAPRIDTTVVVVGGGVIGAAVAYALARRSVEAVLLEAEDELATGASGTNSGILHTGFDSYPGELETQLILRSAALREQALEELDAPILRCGATLVPRGEKERATVAGLAERARHNGVAASLRPEGALDVPGEAVTDPVAYVMALAEAASSAGADVRTSSPVDGLSHADGGVAVTLASGDRLAARVVVNCAGLHADEVARLGGDSSLAVYPRKGEFFVFDPPAGEPLDRIHLPVPTERTKGVLVFPTIDGKVVAGPTAHDQEDKTDWSVRPEAWSEIRRSALRMLPALEGAEPIGAYAGLRPAGRHSNYSIGASAALPGLVNVAAICSTGLSASLAIGEHVTALVERQGVALEPDRSLPRPSVPAPSTPWWRRAGGRHAERA